eukprot:5342873-Pleurochrysis_carterae.AAC.1
MTCDDVTSASRYKSTTCNSSKKGGQRQVNMFCGQGQTRACSMASRRVGFEPDALPLLSFHARTAAVAGS